jgi:phosphate transport system ATP-binding protein
VAFLMNGNLIETGPTEKMFISPKNKVTSNYLNGRFG